MNFSTHYGHISISSSTVVQSTTYIPEHQTITNCRFDMFCSLRLVQYENSYDID